MNRNTYRARCVTMVEALCPMRCCRHDQVSVVVHSPGAVLAALVLYPLVWLILLPFRVLGIAVGGVLELVKAINLLPARVLRTV